MAKNKSLFKIEGTLDEFTFYKTADGHFIRTKGGVSKKRILTDPAFARTRENMNEFKLVAESGRYIRHSLGRLLTKAKDPKVTGRLTSVLHQIKKLDQTSDRGQRSVGIGLASNAGKALLKGFDFNRHAPLNQILIDDYQIDTTTGQFTIADFVPLNGLYTPEGATHLQFSVGVLQLDLQGQASELQMKEGAYIPIDMNTVQIALAPDQMPSGNGVQLFLVMLSFYQEVNQKFYDLRNGSFNVLHVIEVV